MTQVELEPDNNNVVKPRNKTVMSSSTRLEKSGFGIFFIGLFTLNERETYSIVFREIEMSN